MSIWSILGIAPTIDKRELKRAYATKLKLINPDEQPEEFQRLKTAFDSALTLAKNDSLIESKHVTLPTGPTDSTIDFEQLADKDALYSDHPSFSACEPVESFYDILQRIIEEEDYFYDLSVWKEVTALIDHWSIDEYMHNTYTIQLLLVKNYPCLAKEVIHFLFKLFDLTELTDHIGQERFVSTEFMSLKKTIYNVPPFSFQIADEIPKNQREDYFHLRYDIYQMIVDSPDSVEKNISECATIFAYDSELWNLQMIQLLNQSNGLLDNAEDKVVFASLLERTKTMNNNPTTDFLTSYFALLNGTHTDNTRFTWHKELLTIPDELFMLLLGSIFFHTDRYISAFNLWKQLDLSRKIALQEQFKRLLPYLSKNEEKAYHLIEKEIKRAQKKKSPVLKALMEFFAIPLIVIVLLFFFHDASINNSNRTPEQLLDVLVEKESLYEQESNEEIEAETKLYGATLEEQFVHYFYASNDPKGKQLFIDRNVYDQALRKLLDDYVNRDTSTHSDHSAFTFEENFVSDPKSRKIAVYYDEELLCILETGESLFNLTNVYGNQWHPLSENEFQTMLQSIKINPESSTTIFLKKFLFSDKKQQNLLEYTDYLSENMKKVIENKLNEPISEKLKRGFLYVVKQPQLKFIVSDQNQEKEEKLILTFDDQGRLDHVFGPHWEEVDEEMIHYPNRGAFKNIPTLLEEPEQ